jgi:hypothetical protein
VKIIAQPRLGKRLGFETNQRTIEDIRTIVINQTLANAIVPQIFDTGSYIAILPQDYWFYANSKIYATKGQCVNEKLDVREVQHDDEAEASPFDRSSFEWRISNIRFIKEGIKIFTDNTYTVNKIALDYLKEPRRIHNAQDYINGTYNTLSGVPLTGSQDCELPEMVHREIVDLAVLITAGDLSLPDYQIKQNKLNLTS